DVCSSDLFEKGVLAGETADAAGKLGVEGQVLVPERLMALFADAIKTVALRGVECAAECRLAGCGPQQQRLGRVAMTLQIEKGRADHVLTEIAGGYSHGVLAKGAGGAMHWQLFGGSRIKAPPGAGLAAHFQV